MKQENGKAVKDAVLEMQKFIHERLGFNETQPDGRLPVEDDFLNSILVEANAVATSKFVSLSFGFEKAW